MSNLYNRSPKDSYQELLTIDNLSSGIDGTTRAVQDGTGTSTPLKLSTTAIELNTVLWPSTAPSQGQVLVADSATTLTWTDLPAGNPGTVTSVGLTAGSNKVSVSGSPITSSGNITVDISESNLNISNMTGVLTVSHGGTGLNTLGTAGQSIRVASDLSGLEFYTPAASSSIQSINSTILPDESGNVVISASDVSALPLSGGQMQGNIDANGNLVKNLATPVDSGDAIPLGYLGTLTIDGGTFANTGNVIKIKSSMTTSAAPSASQLQTYEIAANFVDRKIYGKDSNNNIVQLALSASDVSQVALTGSYNDLTDKPNVTGLTLIDFWDASTNTPTIPAASAANNQKYYLVQTGGNTNIDGTSNWIPGDFVVSNGTTWNRVAVGAAIDTTQLIGVSINADPAITKDVTYVFSRATTFGANFNGSQAFFSMVSGATSATVNILKNGTQVGTITYSSGTITFSASSGSTTFAVGDRLTYHFNTTNVQAASITLKGNWQ